MRTCVICGAAQGDSKLVQLQKPAQLDVLAWENAIGVAAVQRIEQIANPVCCQAHLDNHQHAETRSEEKSKILAPIPPEVDNFYENFFHDHDYLNAGSSAEKLEEIKVNRSSSSRWIGADDRWLSKQHDEDCQVSDDPEFNKIETPNCESCEEVHHSVSIPSTSENKLISLESPFNTRLVRLSDYYRRNKHPSIEEMIQIADKSLMRYTNVYLHFDHWRTEYGDDCAPGDTCQRVRQYFYEDRQESQWVKPIFVTEQMKRHLTAHFEKHLIRKKPMLVEYVHLIRERISLPPQYIRQQWRCWKIEKNRLDAIQNQLAHCKARSVRVINQNSAEIPPAPEVSLASFSPVETAIQRLAPNKQMSSAELARTFFKPKLETSQKRATREAAQDIRVAMIVERELRELSPANRAMLVDVAMSNSGGKITFPEKMKLAQKIGISYLSVSHWFENAIKRRRN